MSTVVDQTEQFFIQLSESYEISQNVSQIKPPFCEVLNEENENEEELIEETPDLQGNYRQITTKLMVINNDEVYEVALGENQPIKSIIFDDHCQEMAFPQLFSSGKFGFKVK